MNLQKMFYCFILSQKYNFRHKNKADLNIRLVSFNSAFSKSHFDNAYA